MLIRGAAIREYLIHINMFLVIGTIISTKMNTIKKYGNSDNVTVISTHICYYNWEKDRKKHVFCRIIN